MNNLDRFIKMQEIYYEDALKEIKRGYKSSHWIWYIFPQLKGLGHSSTSEYYGIDGIDEAKEYINNEYLKNNLIEISNELYKHNKNITDILGYPDDLKVKSCMTLFEQVDDNEIYNKILSKFYNNQRDNKTLELLKSRGK